MSYTSQEKSIMVTHLSEMIKYKTVSFCQGKEFPTEEFIGLQRYISSAYPQFSAGTEKLTIDDFTLLYKWMGKSDCQPMMLMAHQDVVPADEEGWTHGPFSGYIDGRHIWGRGSIDMKCQLAAVLEAANRLISTGFKPQNTIYFLFTHNEEGQNETGAQETAKLFEKEGIRLKLVIDEGGYAFLGERYGMNKDGIHIALCEKGYADVEVFAEDKGGHSSTPPHKTALAKVCGAIAAIENNQPKPFFNKANKALMKAIAPYTSRKNRSIKSFSDDPNKNALIRSTAAATVLTGSNAPNVLPSKAIANLNIRLLPGESLNSVLCTLKKATSDLEVSFNVVKSALPTPISDHSGSDYKTIKDTLLQVYPDLLVVPGIMTGATDSRFFVGLSENIFRISPFDCTATLLGTMHGINERIEIGSYLKGIEFFERLIKKF